MKQLKDFVKPANPDFNLEDYYKEKCKYENETAGDYNLEDGYDCPICKNKGYVVELKNNGFYQLVDVKCSCMPIRMSIRSLKRCGISAKVLNEANLNNFKTTYVWQKSLKDKVCLYLSELKEDRNWFYIGGQSGAGKTMLLTAVFKIAVIKNNLTGKYMVWNSEIKELINNSKRDLDSYKNTMEDLKTIDVLYIDDFLKLSDSNLKQELSIAYEIIDARYRNDKLVTLISSEITYDELSSIDGAIAGRIYERAKGDKYVINLKGLEKDMRKYGKSS